MTKYALISGASSGIGYALCEQFSKKGYKVYGCTRGAEVHLMKPLTEKYGVTAFSCDITNTKEILKMKEAILEETGGRLDILYNNAGIAAGGPACESEDQKVEKIFRVNVFGHIAMTREFTEAIVATKGTIIFTSSVAGRVPMPMVSLYCATKAAIDQYAHVLCMEMKPYDVKVVSVITGGVNTAVGDNGRDDFDENAPSLFNVPGIQECAEEVALMARKCPIPVQPHEYATSVVNYLTGHKNPSLNIYYGGMSWILNYLGRYTPVWVQQFFIGKHFKFDKVAANIRKKRAQRGY
ncbi:NADPH-dependent 1-acyldihydroxyacetone phosphate reductase [[Candida] railenensis]|uniref:NADPH-dependent 1-acyldihydroxyacetone phosphate reductase n=1 Tax=[Candida] railenensis TaxID=45579 RepID=A0A9P0QKA5_9ASCO|nr:NADPH-dependent 1-acyldihydroxyacetone phosphate reductase [[Candida] railenensis]